jgi:hypothetical protein
LRFSSAANAAAGVHPVAAVWRVVIVGVEPVAEGGGDVLHRRRLAAGELLGQVLWLALRVAPAVGLEQRGEAVRGRAEESLDRFALRAVRPRVDHLDAEPAEHAAVGAARQPLRQVAPQPLLFRQPL